MSFFTRVFGIFGPNQVDPGEPSNKSTTNTGIQDEPHRSNDLESSGASIESDPQKPALTPSQQPRPITGTAGIKKRDESRKPRKKKEKSNAPLPGVQNQNHLSSKDLEKSSDFMLPEKPVSRSPSFDASKRVPGMRSKGPQMKRVQDHYGKEKELVPVNISGATPVTTPPIARTPEKKKTNKASHSAPKNKKKASMPAHRLRLSDDVFPLTGGSHNISKGFKSRVKTPIGRSIKATKSAPAAMGGNVTTDGRTFEAEVGIQETPSFRERMKRNQPISTTPTGKKKPVKTRSKFSGPKDKKDKAGDKDSIEYDVSPEQLAECAPSLEQTISAEKKIVVAAEEAPVVDKAPPEPIVLDRDEVTRLIGELKCADRNPPPMEHDPWAPMNVLIARTDYYSDQRARLNTAVTYEKFAEYELSSNKDNGHVLRSKSDISIFPTIERQHFDVNTLAVLSHDRTPVIDHEPGTNHPDGN